MRATAVYHQRAQLGHISCGWNLLAARMVRIMGPQIQIFRFLTFQGCQSRKAIRFNQSFQKQREDRGKKRRQEQTRDGPMMTVLSSTMSILLWT